MIWEKQWELFAPNFKDGKAHIDLTPYGCAETLQLYPGPGFGDLSHPTTRIVLRLMQPYVKDQAVLDIGCGSGILSLAAAAMGASQVDGYDIDPEAVEHAKKNATLRGSCKTAAPQKIDDFDASSQDQQAGPCHTDETMPEWAGEEARREMASKGRFYGAHEFCNCLLSRFQKKIHFATQPPKKIASILLMNMISSEQAQAWSVIEDRIPLSAILITSGILEENADEYLEWRTRQGWKVKKKLTEDDWTGFVLSQ